MLYMLKLAELCVISAIGAGVVLFSRPALHGELQLPKLPLLQACGSPPDVPDDSFPGSSPPFFSSLSNPESTWAA